MFRLNMYEQSALNSCGGSCLPYLLIALMVFGGLVCCASPANAQEPQTPGLPAMLPYEERDTLVKYEDGVYLERIIVMRSRINADEYITQKTSEQDSRRQEAERLDAKLEQDVARIRELDDGKSNGKDKQAKKPPDAATLPQTTTQPKRKKG